jgi:ribosome-associated protein
MKDLYINPKLTISSDSIDVSFSRSSGPGGQHVNKINTRVSVFLDIHKCKCFSDVQKHLLLTALKNRTDKQGVLQVSRQEFRSQSANREAAMRQIAELVSAALKPKRKRKKTRVPRRAIEKRLGDKKSQSRIKQLRSRPLEKE